MNDLHSRAVRTTAALGRLAELRRRAEQAAAGAVAPIVRPALKELSGALEELQIANEQLEAHARELSGCRQHAEEIAAQLAEFVNIVPIACLWTNGTGIILEANQPAATLLNVARQRLSGKPLMLFIVERPPFFEALASLRTSDERVIQLSALVRPRERRPRTLRLTGRRLQHDSRWCWFLEPQEAPAD